MLLTQQISRFICKIKRSFKYLQNLSSQEIARLQSCNNFCYNFLLTSENKFAKAFTKCSGINFFIFVICNTFTPTLTTDPTIKHIKDKL